VEGQQKSEWVPLPLEDRQQKRQVAAGQAMEMLVVPQKQVALKLVEVEVALALGVALALKPLAQES